ncbi:MAG TPA: DUF2934 domain-containing protein [Polyangia bacterium]|jgi:hypothetical protein|nr:DUF2934 domain-containing protein [Polyangia bacterium]
MNTRTISEQEIAARAYNIHLRNGRQDGRAAEDWAQALAELESEGDEDRQLNAAQDLSTPASQRQNADRASSVPASARRAPARRGARRLSDGT